MDDKPPIPHWLSAIGICLGGLCTLAGLLAFYWILTRWLA